MSFLSVMRAGVSRGPNVRKCSHVSAIHTFLHPLIHSMKSLEWQLNEKNKLRKEDMTTPKLWRSFVIDMWERIRGRGVRESRLDLVSRLSWWGHEMRVWEGQEARDQERSWRPTE